MRFEHHRQPLLPVHAFRRRFAQFAGIACGIIAASLGLGTVGYRVFGGLPWLDALLNASMILTGMGPVDPMRTTAGKFFAAGYAIFSGVAFLSVVGILLAPLIHRFLHHFHLEIDDAGRGR